MLFLAEEIHRDALFEKIAAFEVDIFIVELGCQCFGAELHAFEHAFCHRNTLGINDKFFRAVTR